MAKKDKTVSETASSPQVGPIIELTLGSIWREEQENLRHFDPDAKKVKELADNIKQYGGLIHPLTVREIVEADRQPVEVVTKTVDGETGQEKEEAILTYPDIPSNTTHKLIAGHQRYKALESLIEEFPSFELVQAQVMNLGTNGNMAHAARRLNLDENLKRNDLSPMDLAYALNEIQIKENLSQKELGAGYGRTQAWAAQTMSLLKLRPTVQKLIHGGAIPMKLARMLPSLKEPEQDKRIAAVMAGASATDQAEQAKTARGKKKSGRKAKEEKSSAKGPISAKKALLGIGEVVAELKALEKPTKADTAMLGVFTVFEKFLNGKAGIKAAKNQLAELV